MRTLCLADPGGDARGSSGQPGVRSVRAAWGSEAPFAFSIVNWVCMALLYSCAGRLTAQNGGFRPGQSPDDNTRYWDDVMPLLHSVGDQKLR